MLVQHKMNHEAAIQAAYEGQSIRRIYLAMGCSYYLFCQELKNNPLFAQRMQDAVTAGMLLLQDKVRFLVEDNPDADPALLRVQLSAYTTLLKAYHPDRFGDRGLCPLGPRRRRPRMDDSIISYLRRHQNLLIGESTAERIKTSIGTARMPDDGRGASMQIRGRDLLNGVPKETEINQAQVAEALAEPVQQICDAVMQALEATPPDLAADTVDRGVMLTGGGALQGELDLSLREQTGLSISVANESLNCVALGTGKALEYEKQLRHVIDYDT